MKLYLILPLAIAAGLAVEPAMGQGRGGHGGHPGMGARGGFGGGGGGVAISTQNAARVGSMGANAAVRPASVGRAVATQHRGGGHRAHHHGGGRHHHNHGGHRGNHAQRGQQYFNRAPATYPANFANRGYSANYQTPYYQGGFRQTSSPYGFLPTYRSPYGYGGFTATPYQGQGWQASYGHNPGYVGNNYPAYRGSTYSPYYRGDVLPGYRPYGVYGPQGPYTVPGTSVGTASVQSMLMNAGYYRGPVDGFAGPLTRSAITSYQYQWGLPVTGRVDGHLIKSLRDLSYYSR